MKFRFAALGLLLSTIPAVTQWQVDAFGVPVGRGAGKTGFAFFGPCTANVPLVGGGAAANPACGTASAVLDVIGSTRGSILYRGASGWAARTPGTSGLFLKSFGAGADPDYAATIVRVTRQTFCASGCTTTIAGGSSGTYTPTTGLVITDLECVGGGAGGGSVVGALTFTFSAAGGGGGGYSRAVVPAATVGASKSVLIGVGGAGGTSGGANAGTNGGPSCFTSSGCASGQLVSALGGTGGQPSTSGSAGLGGPGGAAGTGDIKASGGAGVGAFYYGSSTILILNTSSGVGGNSPWGGGGTASAANGNAVAGNAGVSFGGGGSGAAAHNSATNAAGGPGAPGICVATEYLSQ